MDSLWLVRLPESVGQAFSKVPVGSRAGSLEVSSDGKLVMRVGDSDSFALEELKGGPQLLAFDADEALTSFSYKGSVTKNFSMKPSAMSQLEATVRRKSEVAADRPSTKHARKVEVMESSVIGFVPPAAVRLKLQAEDIRQGAKRARNSDEPSAASADVQRKIFEMFAKEESGRITLKGLLAFVRAEFAGVGEKDVKDELEKYAAYIRKGPNKGTWERRADYAGR